jgi:DNA-binding transcriptional ArsR family regulator
VAAVHAFDVLGDPVRRRILELLADGEQAAGEVGATIRQEFGISQPAVSQHLRVLRDSGFATVRSAGTRRLYAVDPAPLQEIDRWLQRYRAFWDLRLDALGTELARGRRKPAGSAPRPQTAPDARPDTAPSVRPDTTTQRTEGSEQ